MPCVLRLEAQLKRGAITLLVLSALIVAGACATSADRTQVIRLNQEPDRVWPPPPQKPRIQFLKSISGPSDIGVTKSWLQKTMDRVFGGEEREVTMLRPYGIFAHAGRIYVTDPGIATVHVFDLGERSYFPIRRFRNDILLSPIGIAADESSIYLTDSVLKRVFVFDQKGNPAREVGMPATFIRPAGIAVRDDRIYVVDTHAHKVLVFAKQDGRLLFQFGRNGRQEGEFNYPTNIFVGKDEFIYVTDSLNFRVQIFDKDGNFVTAFGKHGDGSGDFSKPKGIAVDSEGHIYVADAHFDNIQIFDRTGALLLVFGNTGRKSGEMVLPAGIFIDDHDRIYVADSYNNRIQIFQYLKEDNEPDSK